MRALLILRTARAAGLTFRVQGEHLIVEAPSAPPPDLLDAVSRHKAEILKFLRHDTASWTTEDWRALFDERAGIASSTATYRVMQQKRKPLTLVSSNGSAEILSALCLGDVWAAVANKFQATV